MDLRKARDQDPQIVIFNISGRLINNNYRVINENGLLKITTEELSSGMYIVQLTNNNGSVKSLKFSVVH